MDEQEIQVTLQFTFVGVEPVNVEYVVNHIQEYAANLTEYQHGQVAIMRLDAEDDNGQAQ